MGGRASVSYAEGYGIPRRARSRKHGIPQMPATRFWDYYLIILIEQFSNLSTTGLYTMELIYNTIYMRKGIGLLITWYVPEYKEIEDRYFEESRKLDQYRDECKDRAIDMFKEWFWDLWD